LKKITDLKVYCNLERLNPHVEVNHIKTTLIHRTCDRVMFYLVRLKVPNKFEANIIDFFSEVCSHCKNGCILN